MNKNQIISLIEKRLLKPISSFSDGNFKYWVIKDLFPEGINKSSKTIFSEFNSLVLMETNDLSYHGVSKVKNKSPRRCISNYYFSSVSTNDKDYNHVTSFFTFQSEGIIKKLGLAFDRNFRSIFSKYYKKLTNHKNWHKR